MDILCFGFTSFGQLSAEKFTSIQNLTTTHEQGIKSVSFSWNKCFILFENGTVIVRGFADKKTSNVKTLQLPFDGKVIKITCSGNHELCLTEDGSCWKYHHNEWQNVTKYLNINDDGDSLREEVKIVDICSSDTLHLALSHTGIIFNIPIQIETPPKIKIKKICCGLEHSLCLADNGSVFTWGSGSRGQLGNDSLNLVENPELLRCLDGIIVTNIDAGGWHSAAVTICGDLYTWGWNNFGQLGFRTNKDAFQKEEDTCTVLATPKCVEYPYDENIHVKQVSCGTQHTLILLENGLVYGCGWNKYGQIDPTTETEYFDGMTLVPVPSNIQTIHNIYCEAWNSALYVSTKK